MIRPLRRQHRLMIVALAIALLIVFIAGLLARPHWTAQNQTEFYLLPATGNSSGGQQ